MDEHGHALLGFIPKAGKRIDTGKSSPTPFLFLFSLWLVACHPKVSPPPMVDLTAPAASHLLAHHILILHARVTQCFLEASAEAQVHGLSQSLIFYWKNFDPLDSEVLFKAMDLAVTRGDFKSAQALLDRLEEQNKDPLSLKIHWIESLLRRKYYARARREAFDALDLYPDSHELKALADQSIDNDPKLLPPQVQVLKPDRDLTAIKALGGGSTITLKLIKDSKIIGVLKPNQDLGQSMYRSEIAYYRLCQIIRCHFEVPYNRPVKIARPDFDLLYHRIEDDKQRHYQSKLVHMIWQLEGNQTYVYGTAKDWVPEFTNFIIEAQDGWVLLLRAHGTTLTYLQRPAKIWLKTFIPLSQGQRYASRWRQYMQSMTIAEVARQLSDLIAVDFLTNNWDRFSETEAFYGANCHLGPGRFIAIDNGAAFPIWQAPRVRRRLRRVQRFSRSMILALRRLEFQPTLRRLFPNPTPEEQKRFRIFWDQREFLLQYVQDLIDEYGESEVLIFP